MTEKRARLIPTVIAKLRRKGYSYSTEKVYVYWIKRFIRFHSYKHPREMTESHIREFLSHLAMNLNVSASTQNQALNALVFLFREVLQMQLGDFSTFERAKKPKLLPVVLSREELAAIFSNLNKADNKLIGKSIYL